MKKVISGILLTLLLIGMSSIWMSVVSVKAEQPFFIDIRILGFNASPTIVYSGEIVTISITVGIDWTDVSVEQWPGISVYYNNTFLDSLIMLVMGSGHAIQTWNRLWNTSGVEPGSCGMKVIVHDYDYWDPEIYFFGPIQVLSPTVIAAIDINPDTLNLQSRGRWITAYIEFPEDYDVNDINVSSIMLNDTIPANIKPIAIGDYESDTVPDLMVKFDRAKVTSYILGNIDIEEKFTTITLTITGKLYGGTPFQGSDTIKIAFIRPRHWRFLIFSM